MKTVLFALLGFLGGIVAAYAVAAVGSPRSYEDALPLICVGAVVGPVVGVLLARRGRKAPSADTGSR
jgi:hypothetical protein